MDENTWGSDGMESKFANRPNLLRVATELAGYKNPDKILNAVKLVLEGGADDSTNAQKDISLLSS